MSNDESFFREVEEEYRREQTAKFFKTYGTYLIAAAFVVLAIVGAFLLIEAFGLCSTYGQLPFH